MKPFPTHQDRLPLLSIQDKAERHLLPDELSIEEIGTLLYEDKVDRHGFYYGITEACQSGEIKYSGDIDSERVNYDNWAKAYREVKFPNQDYKLLDYPEKEKIDSACLQAYWEIVDRNSVDIYKVMSPANCLIHRDDLAEYLKTKELWPVEGCLLAGWWHDESQTEMVGDNTSGSVFEKRLVALRKWMDKNKFKEGSKLPKHFTIKKVYGELCEFDTDLFCSFELPTFKRHFWAKQKLCSLTSGRKDGVV